VGRSEAGGQIAPVRLQRLDRIIATVYLCNLISASLSLTADLLVRPYKHKPPRLFSHYLNDDPLIALSVELGVEDLLPRTEIKLALRHWNDHFVMNDQRFQVSVSVVFSSLVMLVVLPEGSERLQPLVDVFDQAALVVVDIDSSRNMHGRNQDHAIVDPRFLKRTFNLGCQMHIGAFRLGVEGQIFGMEFHCCILWENRCQVTPPAVLFENWYCSTLPAKRHNVYIIWCYKSCMRTTVALDDDLVRTAQEFTGVGEKTALIREALKALIERESARRFASLEGYMPKLKNVRRRRPRQD
jgi:Arc/MetJ family transcription regulator